jgi:hypothetical protein
MRSSLDGDLAGCSVGGIRTGSSIANKFSKYRCMQDLYLDDFASNATTTFRLNHRNIRSFLGLCNFGPPDLPFEILQHRSTSYCIIPYYLLPDHKESPIGTS